MRRPSKVHDRDIIPVTYRGRVWGYFIENNKIPQQVFNGLNGGLYMVTTSTAGLKYYIEHINVPPDKYWEYCHYNNDSGGITVNIPHNYVVYVLKERLDPFLEPDFNEWGEISP